MTTLKGKLLSKFVKVISPDEVFFSFIEKPDKVSLSREAIAINYSDLSPFKGGDFVFYQDKNAIFLWFTKEKPRNGFKIYLPLGYLVYKNLRKLQNVIIITPYAKDRVLISVIKNGLLVFQAPFFSNRVSEVLTMLKKKYSLTKVETHKCDSTNIKLNLTDIFHIFKGFLPFNFKEIMQDIVSLLWIPVSFSFIYLVVLKLVLYLVLQFELDKKRQELNYLLPKVNDIKTLIDELERKEIFWSKFLKENNVNPSIYSILNLISSKLLENKGYMKGFESVGDSVFLKVSLKSETGSFVKELLSLGILKNIRIVSSMEDRERKGFRVYYIRAQIKRKM